MKSDNVFKVAVIALLVFIAYQLWWGNKLKETAFPSNAGQLALSPPQPFTVKNETVELPSGTVLLKILGALASVLTIVWQMIQAYSGN